MKHRTHTFPLWGPIVIGLLAAGGCSDKPKLAPDMEGTAPTDATGAGAAAAGGDGSEPATGTGSGSTTGASPGSGAADAGATDSTNDEGDATEPAADPPAMDAVDATGGDGAGGALGEAPDDATGDASSAARPPSAGRMLEVTVENPEVEPYFNVYRPADMQAAVEQTGGPLPVIVWASGGCFCADFAWAALLERWAAGGYVVLGLTPGPDASVPGTTTAVEHGQLIDWAFEQTEYPDMLDLDRIVASGNSCGGVTALEMTSMDDRVTSVFVLSGSSAIGSANATVMAGIDVPLGFVVGNAQEDIAAGPAEMDYELLADGIAGMLVNRTTGDHFVVSTGEAVLPEVAEIALNWMDLTLYGTPEAAAALESPDVGDGCTPGDWTLKQKHWDTLLP